MPPTPRKSKGRSLEDISHYIRTQKESPANVHEGEVYNCIALDKLPVDTDTTDLGNLRDAAKNTLMSAIDNAMMDFSTRTPTYGNGLALTLIQESEGLGKRLTALSEEVEALKTRTEGQEKMKEEVQSLRSQVSDHDTFSEGFTTIRQRFFDCYRRDVLKEESMSFRRIRQGNAAAHEGNCSVDLMLYERHLRNDQPLFVTIYGINIVQARRLKDIANIKAIGLIDSHVTLKVEARKDISELQPFFDGFLKLLMQDDSPASLDDHKSPIGKAYFTYWAEFNKFDKA